MKVKMKIKYRKSWIFVIAAFFELALLGAMAFAFALEDHNYVFAVLCFLLGIIIFIAFPFRFNYGLTINEKRLIAIEQSGIKILRYNDISRITVKFSNKSVATYIKMMNQQEYVFVWEYIFLGTNVILPSKNMAKIDNKFVEKSIASLSVCPKVKIQNFYTSQ